MARNAEKNERPGRPKIARVCRAAERGSRSAGSFRESENCRRETGRGIFGLFTSAAIITNVRVLLACFVAGAALAAHAQSSGAVVSLDDGSLVVAAGSSVCHRYSTLSKVATMFVGLGYAAGGETYDSAALGLESITAEDQPNTRFGRKGVAITPLLPPKNHDGAFATALVRDAQGRLIVVGWRTQSLWPDAGVILVSAARYDASGTLDPSYGDHGLVNVRMNRDGVTEPSAAMIDSQGRLLIAGRNGGRKVRSKLGSFDEWTNHLAVARFTADGKLDASFGDRGFALVDVVPEPSKEELNPKCLEHQTRDTCIWAHKEVLKGNERQFLVYVHAPVGLAIDAQNRIVAGGSASDGTWILARFLADGKLDTTFGSGGTTRTVMPADSSIAQILIERSGRLLVVGTKGDRIALAHYTADGVLEGAVRETAFAAGLFPSGAVLAADGHLFVGAAGEHTLAIGLFRPDWTPVTAFGPDGVISHEVARLNGPAGLTVNASGEPTVAAWSEHGVAAVRAKHPGHQ